MYYNSKKLKTVLTLFCTVAAFFSIRAGDSILNVKKSGAAADGKTDDSTIIQKLVDSAPDGATIYFPAGRYFLTRDIEIKKGNITLSGGGTLIFFHKDKDKAFADNRKIKITGKNVNIRDLKITSTAKTRSAVYGLISCFNAENIRIENVDISFSPSTSIYSINSKNMIINKCYVHDQWADGIHISRNSRNVIITNCIIDKNGDDGIGVVSYHDEKPWNKLPRNDTILLSNNIISRTPARGICASGGNLIISGNSISETGKAGIICTKEGWISGNTVITGNSIHDTGTRKQYGFTFYNSAGTRAGIHVQLNRDMLIADNNIYNCEKGYGICITAGVNISIKDNIIANCARGISIDNPQAYIKKPLAAHLMKELYYDFKQMPQYAGCNNLSITGNVIRNNIRDGIYAAGNPQRPIDGTVIMNNLLYENNSGNSKFVRDIWLQFAKNSVVKNNVSKGTSATNGLSPVQGQSNCTKTLFEQLKLPAE
jgi:hypothetical protein